MDQVESDLQNNFPIGWFEDKITREAENVGFLEGTRLTFCPGLPSQISAICASQRRADSMQQSAMRSEGLPRARA